jgi:hypothetical protein
MCLSHPRRARGGAGQQQLRSPDIWTFGRIGFRHTTGTYLTNAPGIFGAASAYRSAKQLGHSVAVAEKHYLGLVRGISPAARTLEDAMGLREAGLRRN